MPAQRRGLVASFTRSQLSSVVATSVDFIVMSLLVEGFRFWSVTATAIGSSLGAITHFMLGRHWSFLAQQGGIKSQAFKYLIVSGIGLVINTYGVYFFTHYFAWHYLTARVSISLAVGIFFNFPLHRHFVFR